MHDALTIGIPVLVILIGILLNRSDYKELSHQILELRKEMNLEFREFYRTMGQHDARLDNLEAHPPTKN